MPPLIVSRADFQLLHLLGDYPLLRRKLARATVVAPVDVPADVVTMDSRLVYADERCGDLHCIKLVYPHRADRRRRIAVTTPLGTALFGLRAGQAIDWHFPDGIRRRLRVRSVITQPERNRKSRRLDRKLDEALMCTFPASDAFCLI
jgi:regulator of nucleoside diphosphate kinase